MRPVNKSLRKLSGFYLRPDYEQTVAEQMARIVCEAYVLMVFGPPAPRHVKASHKQLRFLEACGRPGVGKSHSVARVHQIPAGKVYTTRRAKPHRPGEGE